MHPLEKFRFCPVCGSERFVENDFKSKKCLDCGFVYFFNPSAATAAFIVDGDGRLLVVRRAKDPQKGTLDLPGGFCDLNETAEEAIKREVREETELSLEGFRYLFSFPNVYRYSGFDVHTMDLFFEAHILSGSVVKAKDDVAESFFCRREEIEPCLFGLDSIKKAVKYWLKPSK